MGVTLFDDASLVLIPSGIKASKVYSVKPDDGTGDLDFSRASTATRTNSAGLIESVASNVPRLDYSGGATCPRLLLEGQRTNLITYSEQLNLWSGGNVTITSNTSQSPDGYQNADNVNITATNGFWRRSSLTLANSTSYAASVFVKKSATTGTKTFRFYYNNNAGAPNNGVWNCVVDLTNITATTTASGTAVTGAPTILSTNLVDYGNDWYRVEVSFTTGSGAGSSISEIGFQANGVVVDFDAWGAQLEAGAFPSSYIPTTTAAVTRVVDVYQRNDIYTNGLISAAGGTWVTELKNNVPYIRDNPAQIFIGDGTNIFTSNNFLCIGHFGLLADRVGIFTKNVSFAFRYATTTDSVKIAFKWDGITLDIFVNGVKTNSAIAFPVVALNNFMSQGPLNNLFIQQMLLFPTPLTDAQCIELTTL